MRRYVLIAFGALLFLSPVAVHADCTVTTATGATTAIATVGYSSSAYNATTFTAACSGTISSISIAQYQLTGSSFSYTPYIYDDSAGFPGTSLGTGSAYTVVGSDCTARQTLSFGTPVTVTNGTKYWIVLHGGTTASDPGPYSLWCGSGSGTNGSTYRSGESDPIAWGNADVPEYATFTIVAGGGGGGGGGGTTTVATSTPYTPQKQEWLFMFLFFGFIGSTTLWIRIMHL